MKQNFDYVCQAVYFDYNTIDEKSFPEFGLCYRLGYRNNYLFSQPKEKNFLIKLKHKKSEASIIIEANHPILPMSESSWKTMQKFKELKNLKVIKA